jgi:hypothetical protein
VHLYLPSFSLQTPQSFLLGGLTSTGLCSGDGVVFVTTLCTGSPLSLSTVVSSCDLFVTLSGTCDSSPLIVESTDIIGG